MLSGANSLWRLSRAEAGHPGLPRAAAARLMKPGPSRKLGDENHTMEHRRLVGSSRHHLVAAVDHALTKLLDQASRVTFPHPYWHQRGFAERNPPPV